MLRQIGEGGLAVISQYPPQPVKVPGKQAYPLINVLTILPCFLCLTNQLSKTGMETGDIS